MELKSKCSSKKHGNIEANVYCKDCNIFLCNKCQNFHSDLFQNHKICEINNSNFEKEIFTGFCGEKNHFEKLEFFCKTHNKLCCSSCIIKIQKKGKGLHSNCEICVIEEIRDQKKENLNKNLSFLKKLSKNIKPMIELKKIVNEINKDKENLKLEIQNLFTKIRNKLNEKEEQLFSEIDKQYDRTLFDENFIKKCEKIPNKIKISIEKGEETLKSKWNDDNILSNLINNCIIIENILNDINNINFNIQEIKYNGINFKLDLQKKDIDNFIDSINNFGKIVKYYREKIVDIKKFYENNFNENINFSLLKKDSYDNIHNQLDKNNNIIYKNLTPKNKSFIKNENKKNVPAKMNFRLGFNNNNLYNDFKINRNKNEYKNNIYDYSNNNMNNIYKNNAKVNFNNFNQINILNENANINSNGNLNINNNYNNNNNYNRNNNINNNNNFIRNKACNNNNLFNNINYNNNINIYNSNSKNTNNKYQNKKNKFQ